MVPVPLRYNGDLTSTGPLPGSGPPLTPRQRKKDNDRAVLAGGCGCLCIVVLFIATWLLAVHSDSAERDGKPRQVDRCGGSDSSTKH